MARMKKMWDEIHPELNHFTEKYLRQQATYIEKRGYLLQTANVTNSNTEHSNVETDIQIEDTSRESNNIEVAEAIDNSNNTETPPLEQTCHVTLTDADKELLQTLQQRFFENIEKYKLFDNREQLTYVNKKPSDGELKVIDAIIKTYFDNLRYVRDVTFDDINTVIYSAAVTIKEYLKDVKYAKVRKEEPAEPKWILNLDNKIKRLRRDISHTQLILSCSVNNNYTEHQRRIRERLRYKFGNVKRDTLVYRVKLLTQELKATSSKVSYHRKKIQQDRINRLLAKKPTLVHRSFWGGTVEINKPPSMDEVEKFWNDIWRKKVT